MLSITTVTKMYGIYKTPSVNRNKRTASINGPPGQNPYQHLKPVNPIPREKIKIKRDRTI